MLAALHNLLQAAGTQPGVKVSPHALRHTSATQRLNAGCQVTTIQRLLGHRRLNSTMVYARVHYQTAADDYFAAMEAIEHRLTLVDGNPAVKSEAWHSHLVHQGCGEQRP